MPLRPLSLLALGCALFTSACQNTMFIGEQHAFDLAIEAKNDASEPAKFNFGYESHSAVVVPPKKPLSVKGLASREQVAEGDLLSAFSAFSIERTSGEHGNMAIRSAVATGKAAVAIANQIKGSTEPASEQPAGTDNTSRLKELSPPLKASQAPGILKSMQEIAQPGTH